MDSSIKSDVPVLKQLIHLEFDDSDTDWECPDYFLRKTEIPSTCSRQSKRIRAPAKEKSVSRTKKSVEKRRKKNDSTKQEQEAAMIGSNRIFLFPMVADRRKACAFCLQARLRSEMTAVTKRSSDRILWDKRLGEDFKKNCDKFNDPRIASLFEALQLPIFSERRFHQLSSTLVKPAIEKVYKIQREEVMQKMKKVVDDGGKLHLAGDGQYDSRGYSAMICRFSIMDVTTKYLLDFEVSRKERGGNSMILEKMGHEESLPRLLAELEDLTGTTDPVQSFTTDRCTNLSQSMKNFPRIVHHYDSWHWIRLIRKDVAEKYRQQQFEPLRCWVQPFINHLHYCIANSDGDGVLAFQLIMGFFLHIQNQHTDFREVGSLKFDRVEKCLHDPNANYVRPFLDLKKKEDKKAFDVLYKIMNKGNRQKDLENVSPYFSTSALESFHGLATRYLPKETFYDRDGYIIRSLLAVIHWNHLQMEKAKGNRKVELMVPFFCKTKKCVIFKSRKTSVKHTWREMIYQFAKELLIHGGGTNVNENQEEIDARAEAEEAMYALD